MSRCSNETVFRHCLLEHGGHALGRWIPDDHAILGNALNVPGKTGEWRVIRIEDGALCEQALRAKAERTPPLYRILEIARE